MHHRYPTNSPAIDAEGRGNPAGAHPVQGLQRAAHAQRRAGGRRLDGALPAPSTATSTPTRRWGTAARDYEGDSIYDRKALTDTEYAAYLVDFTRRVLGLDTEEASQVISPITGLDLEAMDDERRRLFALLSLNYMQLTPTGPVQVHDRRVTAGDGGDGRRVDRRRRVGFRENMDIKFLRPHELVVSVDTGPGGVQAVANGSEAKIADSMLRVLHDQGVLKDAGHDLRFNMRPGGNPGRGEFGGVVEAFLTPAAEAAERQLDDRGPARAAHRAPQPLRRDGRRASAPASKTDLDGRRWPRSTPRGAPSSRRARGDAGRAAGRRSRRRAAASSAPTTRCRRPRRLSSRPTLGAPRRL